ncbi:MAG: DUF4870 domain-containing protein [Pseudomonadales bacterium]|nr:DUF4870 domain-containing protein [Pseudomonadales bacterium]
MQETEKVKTGLSTDSKNKATIAYILGFITGLIMLLTNPKDKFVRFHAIQSIGLSVISMIFSLLISQLLFLWTLGSLLNFIVIVFFVISAVKAYQGEKYLVPLVGEQIQKIGESIKI